MSRFPWFHINSLQAQCDKGAWSRGMDLFRRAGVVRTDIEAEHRSIATDRGLRLVLLAHAWPLWLA